MAKKQFKAESKRLLDLMIHSIYTHKEIFLRELISNASDAIDKLYYRSLTEQSSGVSREGFGISITVDKEQRTLTITDNGLGMTKEELEQNLGTIARSGSLDFKTEMEKKEDIDIIGQFGVGFYSSFMVSDKVTVISKAFGTDQAWKWESSGTEGYTITEAEQENAGTSIILNIKENTEEEKFDEYLEPYRIQSLIKRYSDYIRYPIRMEDETLNSMVPIWKKNRTEISDEEYQTFFKEKYYQFEDAAKVIHTSVEGVSSYTALLFVPAKAPYNYYTKEYEKGLQLYSSGVLIMDKCPDLLPDYFGYVKGLVDSQDLSLNISREMLQHDRQLRAIASRLEKKIKSELVAMMQTEREKYEEFFKIFGMQLKYGVYDQFGANQETLRDLLLYYSSSEKRMVSLSEYISRMKEEQKFIYYAVGSTTDQIDRLPQTELLKDKGFEILYMTDDVDEFAIHMMREYEGKEFKSVSSGDLGLPEQESSEETRRQEEENKDLFGFLKEALGDKVTEVKLSGRLKTHAVCLTSSGPLSLDMEKVLNAMPSDEKVKADRVLEINASHPVFASLQQMFSDQEGNREKLALYADLLYQQALLIEGLPIEDPVAFSNAICRLM